MNVRQPIGEMLVMSSESPVEMRVHPCGCRPLARTYVSSSLRGLRVVTCWCGAIACNIMSTSRWNSIRKALMTNTNMQVLTFEEAQCISQLCFGLDKMEAYYLFFKGKRCFTVEAQFKVESFKDDFSNIYNQISIQD
ncbi:hypothetical protein HAX54_047258 [Datura stramonium]|uniref:Uncharacterized protein n=1 Tax=Datura stramonium TaxID=4076 RepID=A0ABS8RQK6_DATST|nr:hypothetical protein [Datura stramonium]